MEVEIDVDGGAHRVGGTLSVPSAPKALIAFAHGSGSSRFSPRNRYVARELNVGGFATLLADLLTREEEAVDSRTFELRFDISLLADRLADVTRWAYERFAGDDVPIGYFGASTGAAAALVAASRLPDSVFAVVSRGGRPDLAGAMLGGVRAPTLLIVGGADPIVIDLNRHAAKLMTCEVRLEIVPGATHLFEESGTLERVADLATRWFGAHLAKPGVAVRRQLDLETGP